MQATQRFEIFDRYLRQAQTMVTDYVDPGNIEALAHAQRNRATPPIGTAGRVQ